MTPAPPKPEHWRETAKRKLLESGRKPCPECGIEPADARGGRCFECRGRSMVDIHEDAF